jgi:hypothetical protein
VKVTKKSSADFPVITTARIRRPLRRPTHFRTRAQSTRFAATNTGAALYFVDSTAKEI